MNATNIKSNVKITGLIVPEDRDKSGNVLQVSLQTDDFTKYILSDNNVGNHLVNLVQKNVNVMGSVIGEYYDGCEILNVQDYEIIDDTI